jgi:hypothetical protein
MAQSRQSTERKGPFSEVPTVQGEALNRARQKTATGITNDRGRFCAGQVLGGRHDLDREDARWFQTLYNLLAKLSTTFRISSAEMRQKAINSPCCAVP